MLDPAQAAAVQDTVRANAERAYADYLALLNQDEAGAALEPEREGLARELARIVLPLNTYTEWYWKTDLHNLLHFIALRADPHAQYEIRAYAEVLLDVVRRWAPLTCAAFEDYRLHAAELSGKALAVVAGCSRARRSTQADSGLSARESGAARTPLTCAAFEDYRLHAAELSGKALAVLRRMLAGEDVSQADSGLSAREWRELQAHLQQG